jgi:hypothetical protein
MKEIKNAVQGYMKSTAFSVTVASMSILLTIGCTNETLSKPPQDIALDPTTRPALREQYELSFEYLKNGKMAKISKRYSCLIQRDIEGYEFGKTEFHHLEFEFQGIGSLYVPVDDRQLSLCNKYPSPTPYPDWPAYNFFHQLFDASWVPLPAPEIKVYDTIPFERIVKLDPRLRPAKVRFISRYKGPAILQSDPPKLNWVSYWRGPLHTRDQSYPLSKAITRFFIVRFATPSRAGHPLMTSVDGKPKLYTLCDAAKYVDVYANLVKYYSHVKQCGRPTLASDPPSTNTTGMGRVLIHYSDKKNIWRLAAESDIAIPQQEFSAAPFYQAIKSDVMNSRPVKVPGASFNFILSGHSVMIEQSEDPHKSKTIFYDPETEHLYLADIWTDGKDEMFESLTNDDLDGLTLQKNTRK